MKHILFTVLIVGLLAGLSFGQQAVDGTDTQARLLVHVQRFPEKRNIGFAGWAIVPDMTRRPLRGLFIAGVIFRDAKKQKWVEVMGGAFIDTKGHVDPVIDVRAADNSRKKLSLNGEVLYATKARRTLANGSATTPLGGESGKKFGLRVGGEAEVFFDRAGQRGAFGPRISVVVPRTQRKLSVVTSYLFGVNQQNVWRTYVILNL